MSSRPSPRLLIWPYAAVLIWAITLMPAEYTLRQVSWASLLLGGGVVAGLAYSRGFWAAPTVLSVLIFVFHIPLTLYPILGQTPDLAGAPVDWLYEDTAKIALWYSMIGLVAFGAGSSLVASTSAERVPGATATGSLGRHEFDPGRIGFCLIAISAATWFYYTISALGPAFFLTSYETYKNQTSAAPFPYVFYAFAIGLCLLAMSRIRRARRAGFLFFALFGLFALPLGLRGEVLFPLAGFAVIHARRRATPSVALVLIGAIAVLGATSLIKDLRQVGLGGYSGELAAVSPLDGVGELGYSVRTVNEVIRWHQLSVPPRTGETYWAPVDRLLGSMRLADPPPPAASDQRLMNIEMRSRVGNLGGSVIAEAYRNFELAGVILVLGGLGAGVTLLARRPATLMNDVLLAVILTAALQHVRNSFTPIPFQICLGLILLLFIYMIRGATNEGASRPVKPRPDFNVAVD